MNCSAGGAAAYVDTVVQGSHLVSAALVSAPDRYAGCGVSLAERRGVRNGRQVGRSSAVEGHMDARGICATARLGGRE